MRRREGPDADLDADPDPDASAASGGRTCPSDEEEEEEEEEEGPLLASTLRFFRPPLPAWLAGSAQFMWVSPKSVS